MDAAARETISKNVFIFLVKEMNKKRWLANTDDCSTVKPLDRYDMGISEILSTYPVKQTNLLDSYVVWAGLEPKEVWYLVVKSQPS